MRTRSWRPATLMIVGSMSAWGPLPVAAMETLRLSLKDHRFTPETIVVPAGERFRIEVSNADETPEEFESHDLKVEKIVVGGGTIAVSAGPLQPGTYTVCGDYHPDTAKATVTAVKKD